MTIKSALVLAAASTLLVVGVATAAVAASKPNQVMISYEPPKNPAYQPIYEALKERRVLEKLQELLSPFQLPRPVKLSVAGCAGEADAFYGDDEITICYEMIEKLYDNRPDETTPAGIAPLDTVVGPFVDTSLHEFGHALIDMLNLPVLGREEDAADQIGAYIYLQFDSDEARRLVMGTAYSYFTEAEDDDAAETPEEFAEDFAEVHGTPQQRGYNLLCIAYGADTKLFRDVVTKGYLPKERAEGCAEEYEQIQDAFETLIRPHIDRALARKMMNRTWLRPPTGEPQQPDE